MSEPFVKIMHGSGRPELWLVIRDEHGLFAPLGDTGPIRMPQEWAAALAAHNADGVRVDTPPSVTAAWNTVREEARAIAGVRGLGDLLAAVEVYGAACEAYGDTRNAGVKRGGDA